MTIFNTYKAVRSLSFLILTTLIFSISSCSEDDTFTGNVNVSFASETFDLGDGAGSRSIESLELGIFPTDFEDSYAWDFDAISVSTIKSGSCRFENILMGTYKVGFMKHPQLFKTIQVVPEQTTEVLMLD